MVWLIDSLASWSQEAKLIGWKAGVRVRILLGLMDSCACRVTTWVHPQGACFAGPLFKPLATIIKTSLSQVPSPSQLLLPPWFGLAGWRAFCRRMLRSLLSVQAALGRCLNRELFRWDVAHLKDDQVYNKPWVHTD